MHHTGGLLQTGNVSHFFRHQIARGTTSTGSLLRPFCPYKVKHVVYKGLAKGASNSAFYFKCMQLLQLESRYR